MTKYQAFREFIIKELDGKKGNDPYTRFQWGRYLIYLLHSERITQKQYDKWRK